MLIHGQLPIKISSMTNKLIGMVSGCRRRPCIYFIVKGGYLYIGETQSIPPVRWGGHLHSSGSFSKNLIRHDEEMFYSDKTLRFYGYECTRIAEEVCVSQQKLVARYAEHQVHVKIAGHPTLGPQFRVISDTVRTAPTRCAVTWADALAADLLRSFAVDLQRDVLLRPELGDVACVLSPTPESSTQPEL